MQQELYPHSKIPLNGILLLFGAILFAGVLIGGVASLISRFIYLVLIFPFIMGIASGFVVYSIIKAQKIRSPFVSILAGIFITILVYGSMHFVDYLQFRIATTQDIQAEVAGEYGEAAPNENVQAFIDDRLVEETGISGFIGFILLEAKKGVSISHVGPGSNGSGINLGVFTWVYWLIEIGIIGWISVDSAYKKAVDLFCEHCDVWIEKGDHIGGVEIDVVNQAVDLIKQRDFVGLMKMLRDDTEAPSVEFYARTCKTCNTFPLYLNGLAVSLNRRGQPQSKLFTVQVLNSSERLAVTSELKMLRAKK